MQISLFNTLTRRKDVFTPSDPKRVTMYVCGPTVYNYAHIGNARPPVVFDVLFRLLRRTYGADAVLYARNYTDIDDKIIAAAAAGNVSIDTITEKFKAIYDADIGALGVLAPTHSPRATQHVDGMIAVIQKLIDAGAAYAVSSGVYFAVNKDNDYGKLSGRSQDELQAGARVEGEDDKRNASDFALWKAAKPGEPAWDAPFGRGRPGWHIECSAMIESELGSPIDIHGGGIDLVFPHHENEIAQSETAHGHALARVWMHNGFLSINSEKMSKSLGNFITVHELLEQGWAGETLRYALLSAHYKAPLDWSDDLLKQAKATLDHWYGALLSAKDSNADRGAPYNEAHYALADDLNTPQVFASMSYLASELNRLRGDDPHTVFARKVVKGHLLWCGDMVGLLQQDPNEWFRSSSRAGDLSEAEIDKLVAERMAARAAKNFAEADRLRGVLAEKGVEVMDNAAGSTWRRKG